ncbi:unnamed protein product [Musa hybrid cultivar]
MYVSMATDNNFYSGRIWFEDCFSNRVKQLTFTFPEDATTSTGPPFWSAPKRFPRPYQFSSIDPSHLQFVMAASILGAETFGIFVPDWTKNPEKLAEAVHKLMMLLSSMTLLQSLKSVPRSCPQDFICTQFSLRRMMTQATIWIL